MAQSKHKFFQRLGRSSITEQFLRKNFRSSPIYSSMSHLKAASGVAAFSTTVAGGATAGGQKLGLSVLVLILPCAATFFLGSWQLQRRHWKIKLLELREMRLKEEPIQLTLALEQANESKFGQVNLSGAEGLSQSLEYRRVLCDGDFDEDKSMFVGPRARSVYGVNEKGFYLVTPLKAPENSGQPPVLVNRGWVPSDWRNAFEEGRRQEEKNRIDASDPAAGASKAAKTTDFSGGKAGIGELSKGGATLGILRWLWPFKGSTPTQEKHSEVSAPASTSVVGVIRKSEKPSMFVPPNSPATGQWFYVDVDEMARTCALPPGNTLLVDASPSDDTAQIVDSQKFPLPKETEELIRMPVMPDGHLTYAATWYTLFVFISSIAVRRIRYKPVRRPSSFDN